ncbi:hypothetical protein DV736_g1872, partial [Chaetothyriales sp. CBS 134916]
MILTSHIHQGVNLRLPSSKPPARRGQSIFSNKTSLSLSSSSSTLTSSRGSSSSSNARSSFTSSASTLVADDGDSHNAAAAATTTTTGSTSTSTSSPTAAVTNYNAALDRHAIPCAYHGPSPLSNRRGGGDGRRSVDMTGLDSEVQLVQNGKINRALLLSGVAGREKEKRDKETMRIKGMKWVCGVMRV